MGRGISLTAELLGALEGRFAESWNSELNGRVVKRRVSYESMNDLLPRWPLAEMVRTQLCACIHFPPVPPCASPDHGVCDRVWVVFMWVDEYVGGLWYMLW